MQPKAETVYPKGDGPDSQYASGKQIAAYDTRLVMLGIVVGLVSGLAAVAFDYSLELVKAYSYGPKSFLPFAHLLYLIVPIIGALIAGPIITRLAREAKGHGIPEVMTAIVRHGSRIRPLVAPVKFVASVFTIGTGGSSGREGPVAQICATLASWIAQRMKLRDSRTEVLVECGIAGGIGAAFNAPLAGSFFAMEIVLERFTMRDLSATFLASFAATWMRRLLMGNYALLYMKPVGIPDSMSLLFCGFLGLLIAPVAYTFVKALYWLEESFNHLPLPEDVKPALGAVVLGCIGFAISLKSGRPLVFGTSMDALRDMLAGKFVLLMLLALAAAKVVATIFTLGSGASGGVFSPLAFVGGAVGSAFAHGLNALAPSLGGNPSAYMVVGMAASFAAAAQAPITAILLLFEMTWNYELILPLMLACVLAARAYRMAERGTVYTLKLRKEGGEEPGGIARELLEQMPVSVAMAVEPRVVELSFTDGCKLNVLKSHPNNEFIVLDSNRRLVGTISSAKLEHAVRENTGWIENNVKRDPELVIAGDSLDTALRRMARSGADMLPVINDAEIRRFVGVVTVASILSTYGRVLRRNG